MSVDETKASGELKTGDPLKMGDRELVRLIEQGGPRAAESLVATSGSAEFANRLFELLVSRDMEEQAAKTARAAHAAGIFDSASRMPLNKTETWLSTAIAAGRPGLVQMLLELDPSMADMQTGVTNCGRTYVPYKAALRLERPRCALAMLEAGCAPPEDILAETFFLDIKKDWALIRTAFLAGTSRAWHSRALGVAVSHRNVKLAEFMLRSGASANEPPPLTNEPLLLMAARWANEPMIDLLLDWGADPNGVDPDTGKSALGVMIKRLQSPRSELVIARVLAEGADPNARHGKDDAFETPLVVALQERNDNVPALLVRAKADPNAQTARGVTPLATCNPKNTGFVAMLLANGADPNGPSGCRQDGSPNTPLLHRALESGAVEVAQLLLGAGARVDMRHWATGRGVIEAAAIGAPMSKHMVVDTLCALGADPNERNAISGKTAIATLVDTVSLQSDDRYVKFVSMMLMLLGEAGGSLIEISARVAANGKLRSNSDLSADLKTLGARQRGSLVNRVIRSSPALDAVATLVAEYVLA